MDRNEFIKLLNQDIQHEIQAALTYLYQSAVAPGFRGEELREILAPDITEEIGHAVLLADHVVALGGRPDVAAPPIKMHETVEEMLTHDIELEEEVIRDYIERAQQADALGEIGLKVQLENLIADETGHRDKLKRIARGMGPM